MFEPDKITRNGGPSNGSAQEDTPLRESRKALMLQGKMWVIARWRGRDQAETGWQGLCAGRECHGWVHLLGRQAARCRHRRGDRRRARGERLATPLRGGRDERRAAGRLGVLRAGRPRWRRVRRRGDRSVDARASDPAQHRGWPARVLLNLVPSRNWDRKTGDG